MRMERDFRMIVPPQLLRSLKRDFAIAECGSFSAASDNADV